MGLKLENLERTPHNSSRKPCQRWVLLLLIVLLYWCMYCWTHLNQLMYCCCVLYCCCELQYVPSNTSIMADFFLLFCCCLYCTTAVTQHTTPPPIFLLTGPGSAQTLRHPMLHLPVICRANYCKTLKKTVAVAKLYAVQRRTFFERLFL